MEQHDIMQMICVQFRDDQTLTAEMGKNLLNTVTGQFIPEYSCIPIRDRGMLYYDPITENFFYDGGVDGTHFYILDHFRLTSNFRSLVPVRLKTLLIEVFQKKEPKTITYSQQVENEILTL